MKVIAMPTMKVMDRGGIMIGYDNDNDPYNLKKDHDEIHV